MSDIRLLRSIPIVYVSKSPGRPCVRSSNEGAETDEDIGLISDAFNHPSESPRKASIVTPTAVTTDAGSPTAVEHLVSGFLEQLRRHPFVDGCRNGGVSWVQLMSFLAQQGYYGQFFTRYLCALISNLGDLPSVHKLTTNLAEEMGFANGDSASETHAEIFSAMLSGFGIDLHSTEIFDETRMLVSVMFAHCRNLQPAYGLGALCLGAEAIVPSLYRDVMAGFKHHGTPDELLRFFRIHVECDDGHAEAMYSIIHNILDASPSLGTAVYYAAREVFDARLRVLTRLTTVSS
jgi:pyrroloquinoline-quinone synthase